VIRIHCQHGTEQYIESKLALNKVHTSTKAADTTKLLLLKKWVKKQCYGVQLHLTVTLKPM